MEQEIIEAIKSFGIGGIFRVFGIMLFAGLGGILSRKIFHPATSFKQTCLFLSLVLASSGITYLIAAPFFNHPMIAIGTAAIWIIVISWICGLSDYRFD